MNFDEVNLDEIEMFEELESISKSNNYYYKIIENKGFFVRKNIVVCFYYDKINKICSKIIINGFLAENPNLQELNETNINISNLESYCQNIFKQIYKVFDNRNSYSVDFKSFFSRNLILEGINLSSRATWDKNCNGFRAFEKNIFPEIIIYVRDSYTNVLYRFCFFMVQDSYEDEDFLDFYIDFELEEVKNLPKDILFMPKETIKVSSKFDSFRDPLSIDFIVEKHKALTLLEDVFVLESIGPQPIYKDIHIRDNLNILCLEDSKKGLIDEYFDYDYNEYLKRIKAKEAYVV